MGRSVGFSERIEGFAVLEPVPEHGVVTLCEGGQHLRRVVSFIPLAVEREIGERVFFTDSTEDNKIDDTFENLVGVGDPAPSDLSVSLADRRGKPLGCGQHLGQGETPSIATAGDELCHQHRPHRRKGTNEGVPHSQEGRNLQKRILDRLIEKNPPFPINGTGPLHRPGHLNSKINSFGHFFPLAADLMPRLARIIVQNHQGRRAINGESTTTNSAAQPPNPSRTDNMAAVLALPVPRHLPNLLDASKRRKA